MFTQSWVELSFVLDKFEINAFLHGLTGRRHMWRNGKLRAELFVSNLSGFRTDKFWNKFLILEKRKYVEFI